MIRKIFTYIKRKKGIINNFYLNAKYMSSGEYALDDSLKYITRNDEYTKKRAYKILQTDYYPIMIKTFIFILRSTLFRKRLSIPEQDIPISDFAGTVYRPVRSSNGYSDGKIFDLAHNKVLSIFSDEKTYCSVIENYENFKDHFPMPSILWTNEKHLLIMEELVQFQPKNSWMKEDYMYVMKYTFDRYFDYFNECNRNRIHSFCATATLVDLLKNQQDLYFIFSEINPDLLPLKVPYLKLHGDLWTSNTLLINEEERRIKYIDWEYSNELVFFYDIFNMMWLEFYVNSNSIYLENYIHGEYDYYFTKMFSLFNLTFNDKFRLDYFHIYFLNFYHKRLIYLEDIDKNDYLNQYKRLLMKVS